jgi:hypothetical protein
VTGFPARMYTLKNSSPLISYRKKGSMFKKFEKEIVLPVKKKGASQRHFLVTVTVKHLRFIKVMQFLIHNDSLVLYTPFSRKK